MKDLAILKSLLNLSNRGLAEQITTQFVSSDYMALNNEATIKGQIAGHEQGIVAIDRIQNKELFTDVLAHIDNTTKHYNAHKARNQKELEANKGFEVEATASIAYYAAAIKTLAECKTEILKLIPSQFDERGERIQ